MGMDSDRKIKQLEDETAELLLEEYLLESKLAKLKDKKKKLQESWLEMEQKSHANKYFSVTKNAESLKVRVVNEDKVPDAFKVFSIDTKEIKTYYEMTGEIPEGVDIKKFTNLTIRKKKSGLDELQEATSKT